MGDYQKPGKVSVWLGQFDTRERFDKYMTERYGNDGPISQFASDMGVSFYDHDALEAVFERKPAALRKALALHSRSSSYVDGVVAAAERAGIEAPNTRVLLFDFAFAPEKEARFAAGKLQFVGVFDYKLLSAGAPQPGTEPLRFVRHATLTAWGTGRVLKEDANNIVIHFEAVGKKQLRKDKCNLTEVPDAEVPSSSPLRQLDKDGSP